MKYLLHSFSYPTSDHVSQQEWDLIWLTKSQFKKKYEITESEYKVLKKS